MKYRYCALCLTAILFAFITSCGGGGGQPGSPGSQGDTGVLLSAVINPVASGSGGTGGPSSSDLDAFQELCSDGKPEPFTENQATVTVTAMLENPTLNIMPGNIYIEEYTIDYRRANDSVGAPPIEQDHRFISVAITLPAIGTTTGTPTAFPAMLVDLPRKIQYAKDVTSGQFGSSKDNPAYLNNYTAVYTFRGKNDYGTSFSFVASIPFVIGDFDLCTQ